MAELCLNVENRLEFVVCRFDALSTLCCLIGEWLYDLNSYELPI